MSVQFGRWNLEGQPPAPDYIEKVSAALAPYGPDSNESYSIGGTTIMYRAFHTTKESRREKQPCISRSGAVITWDGRLDNRSDLINELRDSATVNSTDVTIVAAAYEKWGADCLGKLIGDWALSVWNPRERFVLLAKDFIGTKHLYYSFDGKQITWSTILEPLVLFAGKTFEICQEYVAGWFATTFPAAHLTPYVGIHAVPPSSSVLLRPAKHTVSKNWEFDPGKRIRYRTDAEYEEHFRSTLATAVQRRLRSDHPVLAELSGGMDSSSIVCMADLVISGGDVDCPRLDTISWFDDSNDHIEPDTNELHWITKVEERRGRTGCHINFSSLKQAAAEKERKHSSRLQTFILEFGYDRFSATPTSNRPLPELFQRYAAYMRSQRHLVTLSGLGGDGVTGAGVPTPTPELQTLLARTRLFTLIHQLNAWAARMRKPRLSLLWDAIRGFFPAAEAGVPRDMLTVSWLRAGFVRRHRVALCGYPSRIKLFGPLPSFQRHLEELDFERRLVASFAIEKELLREVRYPYHDRDLLEFMYAIPQEQIVGVGRRRFLMKRALVDIVPDELLNRRRRLLVHREPMQQISTERAVLAEISQHMVSSFIGITDSNRLLKALQKARHDQEGPTRGLTRTLLLESWLHRLAVQGVLTDPISPKRRSHLSSQWLGNSKQAINPKVQLVSSWKTNTRYRKEVKTMKYKTPELTALTPAINAVQTSGTKPDTQHVDSPTEKDEIAAYQDWE